MNHKDTKDTNTHKEDLFALLGALCAFVLNQYPFSSVLTLPAKWRFTKTK